MAETLSLGRERDRYSVRFPGWRDRYPVPACPLVVLNKRCRVGRDFNQLCLCQTYHRFLDHGRSWATPSGDYVVTGEPYAGFSDIDFTVYRMELAEIGVSVTQEAGSPWNPGQTILLVHRKAPIETGVVV